MHHYILNHREMYGLPRKFNIAFDGGGRVPVLEDTNDIGFVAAEATAAMEPGVYFRLQLGGITGHQDFAHETGVLLKPDECVKVAGAVVRAFVDPRRSHQPPEGAPEVRARPHGASTPSWRRSRRNTVPRCAASLLGAR